MLPISYFTIQKHIDVRRKVDQCTINTAKVELMYVAILGIRVLLIKQYKQQLTYKHWNVNSGILNRMARSPHFTRRSNFRMFKTVTRINIIQIQIETSQLVTFKHHVLFAKLILQIKF